MGAEHTRGVVLVGHGGVPKDCPRDMVMRLKRLEGQRREQGLPPTAEEIDLDRKIRDWPRSPETDPYKYGLESLAERLRPLLNGALFTLAYNEFCVPTIEEAVEQLVVAGAREITVISTMFTPGGSHAEIEIPESLALLRERFPHVEIRYAWPFDLEVVAAMLARQLAQISSDPT